MNCSHEETTENYPECETVCTLCGLVLQPWEVPMQRIVDELHFGEAQIFLEDLVHNAHIYEGVVKPTLHSFKMICDDNRLRLFKKEELICFCLFSELLKNNVGRSMNEIAYFGGVDRARIYKIQKVLNHGDELEPENLIARLVDELFLPFSFHSSILNILHELHDITSAKPETKAASAIYLCCQKKQYTIDKTKLCRFACVQWPSVRSLVKKYANKRQ